MRSLVMQFRIVLITCLVYSVCVQTQDIGQEITLGIKHECEGESQEVCHTTKRYHFVTIFKANFFKAHQYCQLHNLELLTIDSKDEEIAFLNLLNSKDFIHKSAKDFWTSGTDLGNEGHFFFLSNGKSVDELTWAHGEPNNAKKSDSNETENCMSFTMNENLKFFRLFDRFCSMKFYFICQETRQRRRSNVATSN
ncbi:unnamed protein product [Chironomus riparius]|uniref:C-type lectin domain-containing protein n=1 Tax=Chironomus riparius TaxID=315576 RepID=A0A9N9WPU9_9DIPT|nr:unnamed protein product [Chironomus riparius]